MHVDDHPNQAGLPRIPRLEWPQHPRFPEQVLLMRSHERFLEINRWLIELVLDGSELRLVARAYRRWISAMRSHERYEEHKLYPFLSHHYRVPGNTGTMKSLKDGHEALHQVHERVLAAFHSEERGAAIEALTEHHGVLEAHLQQEEDAVIPALLALSPEEFQTFTESPIEVLLMHQAG